MLDKITINRSGVSALLNNNPGLKAALQSEANKLATEVKASATSPSRIDASSAKVSLAKSSDIGFTKLSKRSVAKVSVTFSPGAYEKNVVQDMKEIMNNAKRRGV